MQIRIEMAEGSPPSLKQVTKNKCQLLLLSLVRQNHQQSQIVDSAKEAMGHFCPEFHWKTVDDR